MIVRPASWIAIACLTTTLSAIASEFASMQLHVYGGWSSIGSVEVREDRTVRIWNRGDEGDDHPPCEEQATAQEIEHLVTLLRQIPQAIPRDAYLSIGGSCHDEHHATLVVRNILERELRVRYSLDPSCRAQELPAWARNLEQSLRAVHQRYAQCHKRGERSRSS